MTEWDRRLRVLALLTGALGVGLRLWQFFANRSLWLDELAVAQNMVRRDLGSLLFDPLAFDQIAPPGFLAATWALQAVVPDVDWPFRLVPLLASLGLLPVVYAVGRRLGGPALALGALAVVSFSPALIAVAAITKQYSLDVLVTAGLVYGAIVLADSEGRRPGRIALWGMVGGLSLLFSFPSVLVATALGVALVVVWLRRRRAADVLPRAFALGLPLGGGAAITTTIALRVRTAGTSEYMELFWADGYPSSVLDFPSWLGRQVVTVLDYTVVTPYPYPADSSVVAIALALLALAGALRCGRSREGYGWFVAVPVIVAIPAAVAGLYPLDGRVSFFLAAPLAVLAVSGGTWLAVGLAGQSRARPVAAVSALVPAACVVFGLFTRPPPFGVEHMRPLIQDVSAARLPTDVVWSYYGANQAVAFYGERFSLGPWQAGGCNRRDPRAYLRELDQLRGEERVWIIVTHAIQSFREYETILGYLRTIGVERMAIEDYFDPIGTSAYLFDLSDVERLASTNAEGFRIEGESTGEAGLVCSNGPLAYSAPS